MNPFQSMINTEMERLARRLTENVVCKMVAVFLCLNVLMILHSSEWQTVSPPPSFDFKLTISYFRSAVSAISLTSFMYHIAPSHHPSAEYAIWGRNIWSSERNQIAFSGKHNLQNVGSIYITNDFIVHFETIFTYLLLFLSRASTDDDVRSQSELSAGELNVSGQMVRELISLLKSIFYHEESLFTNIYIYI